MRTIKLVLLSILTCELVITSGIIIASYIYLIS